MNYLYCKCLKNISLALTSLFPASLLVSSSFILASTFPAYGFQLDFSDIEQQPDTDGNPTVNYLFNNNVDDNIGATMRFAGVDPDDNVDLVITVLSTYNPRKPENNGKISTNDGRINLPRTSSTRFNFSFVATGTDTPFVVNIFALQVMWTSVRLLH